MAIYTYRRHIPEFEKHVFQEMKELLVVRGSIMLYGAYLLQCRNKDSESTSLRGCLYEKHQYYISKLSK